MAIGNILDQYSVICVFGSVVGCVVFPLITQSVESLILSAIVISLTAKTLSRKMLTSATEPANVKDDRRRGKERDKERNKDQEKDSPRQDKKPAKKKRQSSTLPSAANSDDWEDEQKKYEEELSAEKERRLEERREKKAKKKQERLKKKEEERKEKEREDGKRREKQLTRAQKKQDIETKVTQQLGFTPIKHLSQISELPRRSIHERTSSTSSNSSASVRSKTKQNRLPVRAASDTVLLGTVLLGTESPLLTPPTSHPSSPSSSTSSKTSPWKPLPSVNITPRWQPDDLFQHQRRVERIVPAAQQSIHPSKHNSASVHHTPVSPTTYNNGDISLAGFTDTQAMVSDRLSSELIKSQSCESLNNPLARQCWVPGPASAPTNLRQIMKEEQTAIMFQQGMSGRLYSLFSGEQSPFSPSLLSSNAGPTSAPRDAWPEL